MKKFNKESLINNLYRYNLSTLQSHSVVEEIIYEIKNYYIDLNDDIDYKKFIQRLEVIVDDNMTNTKILLNIITKSRYGNTEKIINNLINELKNGDLND